VVFFYAYEYEEIIQKDPDMAQNGLLTIQTNVYIFVIDNNLKFSMKFIAYFWGNYKE